MKPWEEYAAPTESGPWSEYAAAPEEPVAPQPTTSQEIAESIPGEVYAAAGGANTLLPAIAGLPMDTATNLANLLISTYGMGRQVVGTELLGETPSEAASAAPNIIPPQPGGSEWIKKKITAGLGADPFKIPDPTSKTQQMTHMGGSILASGTLAPAKSGMEVAKNVARMMPSAVGAITAKETFPDEPLAPMVGMMAAPGAMTAVGKAKAVIAPKIEASKAFMRAHQLGYKVPPVMAKPTKTQQGLEGTAGPVPTKQKASIFNQKVTNNLVKKELGYPKDTPLSPEGLNAVRAEAGKFYEQAKQLGSLKVDRAFNKDISNIARQGSAMSKEFPGMVKKDVLKMVQGFSNKKQISSEALVDVVKQLRADSSVGFKSQDPATLALAKANGKMANALESLMERNIKAVKPEFLAEFKAARQKIAKTYTIEKVLKGENVDAVALGRQLDKGKPLSGTIKDVAEFGQNFKGAAQVNVPQQSNFRPMDLVAGFGAAVGAQNPTYLLIMGARPALRSTLLSKPYQNMLARVKPAAIKKVMKMPERAQAGAIAALLDEFNSLESETQPRSQ